MFVWTWQQQSLFVRHWQCLTMTMFEPSCTTNTNTNTMNTNTIHTYIFIYSYIRSDSFPNKKVILKRAPNFPEYFFPIFRSLCIFPNFWYFPNFQFLHNYFHKFFGVFFRMVRQDIFSNLPKFFFQILEEYFSEFWVFILIFRSIFSQFFSE